MNSVIKQWTMLTKYCCPYFPCVYTKHYSIGISCFKIAICDRFNLSCVSSSNSVRKCNYNFEGISIQQLFELSTLNVVNIISVPLCDIDKVTISRKRPLSKSFYTSRDITTRARLNMLLRLKCNHLNVHFAKKRSCVLCLLPKQSKID